MWEHQLLPVFRKRPTPLSESEREAAEIDLERIQRGGIPLGAEQRLKAIAAASSPVFSSDLSTNEYAIAHASGLEPIAQIMGSSVVQHGWQNYGWASYGGGISDGNKHDHSNLPAVLVGGGAGSLKGGRYLRFPENTPMSNMFVSLLDKVGVPIDKMGDSTGPLQMPQGLSAI